MKNLFLIAMLLLATTADAATKRLFQDIKLPTQQMIERQAFDNVLVENSTAAVSDNAAVTGAAAASITSFIAQPDLPRNVTITPSNTASVEACTVTVTGKNIHGSTITEDFTIANDQSTATTGSKAFKTLTSVAFPAACEASPYGAVWDVGYGTKIGLKSCLDVAGNIIKATANGTTEGTAPTMGVNATAVESNTAIFNTAPNGTNDYQLFYMQNFRCNTN